MMMMMMMMMMQFLLKDPRLCNMLLANLRDFECPEGRVSVWGLLDGCITAWKSCCLLKYCLGYLSDMFGYTFNPDL